MRKQGIKRGSHKSKTYLRKEIKDNKETEKNI